MNRSFRQSRFRHRGGLGEDVNPSAYIVNLADCMLVLACGFMVAMITYWNINISGVEMLEQESLEAVDPQTVLESMIGEGSNYVEAGTVYRDPNTGELWLLSNEDAVEGSDPAAGGGTGAETGAVPSDAPSSVPNGQSRAMGAD